MSGTALENAPGDQSLRGTRVLFVDDEACLAELGRHILEGLGCQVLTQTSSVLALDLFRAEPESFDLVITDMAMPDLSGLELARQVKNIRHALPVVLISGCWNAKTELERQCIEVNAFLQKPVSIHDFDLVLHSVLDGRQNQRREANEGANG